MSPITCPGGPLSLAVSSPPRSLPTSTLGLMKTPGFAGRQGHTAQRSPKSRRGRRKKRLMGARTRRAREKSLNPKATIHLWNPGTERGQLELAEDPEARVWEFGEGASQDFLGQQGGEPPSPVCSSCHPSLGCGDRTCAPPWLCCQQRMFPSIRLALGLRVGCSVLFTSSLWRQ